MVCSVPLLFSVFGLDKSACTVVLWRHRSCHILVIDFILINGCRGPWGSCWRAGTSSTHCNKQAIFSLYKLVVSAALRKCTPGAYVNVVATREDMQSVRYKNTSGPSHATTL